jgi:FKBP-type peptidyl-prolyl cis-trans isomerase 2
MRGGSIVALNYTGKVVATNDVFESTVEKKAVEAGIFNEKQKYKPMIAVVGQGDVLKGLDKALLEIKVGEQREVRVSPEEGWGPRKAENVRVIPLQHFKKEKMNPFPGLVVEVNGMQGKVQTVSGGRVRVDFNHPLAGKELLYDMKVERELVEPKEQIEELYNKYFGMVPKKEKGLSIGKDSVEVTLSPRWSANLGPLKTAFSGIVTKFVKGFEKVRFVEEFKQEKGKDEKAEEKQGNEGKAAEKEVKKPAAEEEKDKKGKEEAGQREEGKPAGKGPEEKAGRE